LPEICRFLGMVIAMYHSDHPRRISTSATARTARSVIDIGSLAVIAGSLPPRALGLVTEWAALHRADLLRCWDQVRRHLPPGRIAPLE
jgi:hypothetical protein